MRLLSWPQMDKSRQAVNDEREMMNDERIGLQFSIHRSSFFLTVRVCASVASFADCLVTSRGPGRLNPDKAKW